MITFENKIFKLDTRNTSYIFKIADCGKLERIHYGAFVRKQSYDALALKNTIQLGSSVDYDTSASYSLDNVLLEYSENGKGDLCPTALTLVISYIILMRSAMKHITQIHFPVLTVKRRH